MELRYRGRTARRVHLRDGQTLKVVHGTTVTVSELDGQSLLRQGGWDDATQAQETVNEPESVDDAPPDEEEPVVEVDHEESEEDE
jgi:hypothetical protein